MSPPRRKSAVGAWDSLPPDAKKRVRGPEEDKKWASFA